MKKVRDLANALNVAKSTVYKWIREKRIPVVKFKTTQRSYIRIRDEDFEKIMKEGVK